jgi:hypothetical protein
MNPILTAFLKLAKRMPCTRPVRAPIFILGTGRSGTTILGKVLSMHRDVGWLNEPKLLWHITYPYEDLIGSYSQGPAYYRLDASHATQDVHRTIRRLYGFYLSLTRSNRIVDKYPEMIFRTEFLRALFPDAKFVFLIRNGWDTLSSIADWSHRFGLEQDGQVHDWWGVNRRKWCLLNEQILANEPLFAGVRDEVAKLEQHTDMAAVEWIATAQEGMRLVEKAPREIHIVRFEVLTTHSTDVLAQLGEFCELVPDEIYFSYACRVLRPPALRQRPTLHPVIRPLFNETMKAIGYEHS